MDYFIVKRCGAAERAAKPEPFVFRGEAVVQAASFDKKLAFPDFISSPYWMFSERIQKILYAFTNGIPWVPFAFVDPEKKQQKLYFIPQLPTVADSISPKSEFNLNGKIKKLALNGEAVKGYSLFACEARRERHLIGNLPVAESLLRNCCEGVFLEKVEVCNGLK